MVLRPLLPMLKYLNLTISVVILGFLVGCAKGVLVAWAVASLVALIRPHLQHVENETAASKLDMAHSHALSIAREVNLITELRSKPPGKT